MRPPAPVFLYFLCDPRQPRRPRYVGMTANPVVRARQHGQLAGAGFAIARWKHDLRAAGLAPILTVIRELPTRAAAEAAEWRLVHRWRRRGLCDLNSPRTGGLVRWTALCTKNRNRWAA